MTVPAINLTQLDGALGVLPPSAGRLMACVGASSSGTANTPATYARVEDVTNAFGQGPVVELACAAIKRTGRPVLIVKTAAATNVGAYGTPVDGITGTSDVTVDTDVKPHDEYDFIFTVVTGGTIGTAGITYKYSLDGGNNYSATTALGTANAVTFTPGNIGLDFAAGTLIAGDTLSVRTSAPRWDDTELLAALTALSNSAVAWKIAAIAGNANATSAGVIETWMAGLGADSRGRAYLAHTRLPTAAESEATYLSSLNTDYTAFVSKYGAICAGAADIISSVSGRNYRATILRAVAPMQSSVSEEINIAALDYPLPGTRIRDTNGNLRHHDEFASPGLDDAGFLVLRTWDREPGVFVNRPRIKSSPTGDFQLLPHRLVMELAIEAATAFLIRRLNKPIRVNATTGFITEADAAEIETGLGAALRSVLLAKPKASSHTQTVSRFDNILSTKTLTVTFRVVPLGYPETIELTVGFLNPALATITA